MKRLFDAPPEIRRWKIAQHEVMANFYECVFRIVEMILVCGFVRYVEGRLDYKPIASIALSAGTAIYSRSALLAGLLGLLEKQDRGERAKLRGYWLGNGFGILLFFSIVYFTNYLVPKIANVQ